MLLLRRRRVFVFVFTVEPDYESYTSLGFRGAYLTDFFEVVLQKSIPAQIRQLILYISNNEG